MLSSRTHKQLITITAVLLIVFLFYVYVLPTSWMPVISMNGNKIPIEEKILKQVLAVDDPEVIAKIRSSLTYPQDPSVRQLLRTPANGHTSQIGQSAYVDALLKNRTNGFFIECGAYNGEDLSNSLFFELKRNWTGLLVEVSTNHYREVLKRKRHAYSINACISPVSSPQVFTYKEIWHSAGLIDFQEESHAKSLKQRYQELDNKTAVVSAICYPLYSMLLAIGQFRVDYFSLDVEGAELAILKTIPFDKVYIDVISLEFVVWGSQAVSTQKLTDFRKFFQDTKLYKEVGVLSGQDVLFKRIDS